MRAAEAQRSNRAVPRDVEPLLREWIRTEGYEVGPEEFAALLSRAEVGGARVGGVSRVRRRVRRYQNRMWSVNVGPSRSSESSARSLLGPSLRSHWAMTGRARCGIPDIRHCCD